MQLGDLVYVLYHGDPGVYHTRILVGHTPDRDIYPEEYNDGNRDINRFWHAADHRVPPAGVYSFAPMNARDYAQLMRDGRQATDTELARRGGGVPAVGAGAVAAVAGDVGEDGLIWVLAEMVGGHQIGETAIVPAGAVSMGGRAFIKIRDSENKEVIVVANQVRRDELAEFCEERIKLCRSAVSISGDDCVAAEDVRTMSVVYLANGERSRSFKETIKEYRQVEFDDFPLEPRTCQSYLRAVGKVAESCYAQHLSWVAQSKIPEGDRAIYEDEVLSMVLDYAIKYDCLNVVNLASFQLVVRRKQLLAEAHVGNPAAPSYEASDYFMGRRYRPGGGIVVPSLTEHVAKRMHEESQVMKEKRKLQEAKGRGKTKHTPSTAQTRKGGGAVKK